MTNQIAKLVSILELVFKKTRSQKLFLFGLLTIPCTGPARAQILAPPDEDSIPKWVVASFDTIDVVVGIYGIDTIPNGYHSDLINHMSLVFHNPIYLISNNRFVDTSFDVIPVIDAGREWLDTFRNYCSDSNNLLLNTSNCFDLSEERHFLVDMWSSFYIFQVKMVVFPVKYASDDHYIPRKSIYLDKLFGCLKEDVPKEYWIYQIIDFTPMYKNKSYGFKNELH